MRKLIVLFGMMANLAVTVGLVGGAYILTRDPRARPAVHSRSTVKTATHTQTIPTHIDAIAPDAAVIVAEPPAAPPPAPVSAERAIAAASAEPGDPVSVPNARTKRRAKTASAEKQRVKRHPGELKKVSGKREAD
jgi:type IV secretory pathway VirB10-like protein